MTGEELNRRVTELALDRLRRLGWTYNPDRCEWSSPSQALVLTDEDVLHMERGGTWESVEVGSVERG